MRHDSIKIVGESMIRLALLVAVLAGFSWLLRQGHPNVVKISIARFFSPMAQIFALMLVIAPLSYLIERLHMPLIDDSLETIDAALGLTGRTLPISF